MTAPYPFTLSVAMRDPHAEPPPFHLCWPSSQQGSHYWAQPSEFQQAPPNSHWRCVRWPDHKDTQIQLRWCWGNGTEYLSRYIFRKFACGVEWNSYVSLCTCVHAQRVCRCILLTDFVSYSVLGILFHFNHMSISCVDAFLACIWLNDYAPLVEYLILIG